MTIISDDLIKKKIMETVRQHPEGLTIRDLSAILDYHRQTITKYVLFLEGAGLIYRRRIGSATLHYLKEQYEKYRPVESAPGKKRRTE